jgi:hypothetical protein
MTTKVAKERFMKPKLILATAIVGTALAVPPFSRAQAPTQDSVIANGATVASGAITNLQIDARSPPTGQDPIGTVSLTIPNPVVPGSGFPVQGAVTCLAVHGNEATLVFAANSLFPYMKVVVHDNASTGTADTAGAIFVPSGAEPDCSDVLVVSEAPVTSGDITVVDATPFPMSKEQCKKGGWRNYPQFKNEGRCVASVGRGS